MKQYLKIKRSCVHLLSLLVAIRQQMTTAAAASRRHCTVSVSAALDKSTRRVAQRHHATPPVTFFRARLRSVSFCRTTAKRLRHVRRECDNERSLLLDESSGVYDPEDLAKLGHLFDQAITCLPTCMRTSENRVAIARLIMQRAARMNWSRWRT